MEHWAAFQESFARLAELFRAIGTGERGEPPASIVALSGDVHHAYLFEVGYPRGTGMRVERLAGGLLAVPQPAREEASGSQIRIGMSRRLRACARARSPGWPACATPASAGA